MDAIGVLPPEQMRELWQWHLSQKQLPAQLTKNFPIRRPIDEPSPHRAFIYNTGSEIIPAFACVRVVGTREINNITAIDVEKPTSIEGEFLFNGPYPIAVPSSTEPGVGWAYRYGVVTMLGDVPTEPGAAFGPIVGSWEIEEGGDKFVVFGRHDFSDRALIGRFNGGGSGGTHEIWFEVLSVTCEADGRKVLYCEPIDYTGSCTGRIPGADEYGNVEVTAKCDGLDPYPVEWLEAGGRVGRATWFFPRGAEYCEARWLLDKICGSPQCGGD